MSKSILLISCLFLGLTLNAQTLIKGTVKDPSNNPIPYSSIGIKNSKTATLANENGSFKLNIPDSLKDKPIIFSALGYLQKSLLLSEVKNNSEISLQEKVAELNEVVIASAKMKETVIGQQSRPMLTFSKMFDQNLPTVEQGNSFELFAETKLKAYNFYIIPSSKFKQITLKLNLYSVSNDRPNESVHKETILYQCSTTGWQHIDLGKYNLSFRGMDKIAVTLQLVAHEALSDQPFIFGLSAKKSLANNLLYRYQNQGMWDTSKGTFIANLEVAYNDKIKKTQKKEEIPMGVEDDPQTAMLVKVIANRTKAQRTGYGKNKTGKYLDVKEGKIYYEEYGAGNPLLLLHGNGGSIADLYQQIPSLSKHFRVIAIDTRGQGKSTNLSSAAYSYQQFSSDVFELVTALKLEKVSILGWSDGGNTGLALSIAHPELVNKLITVGANLDPSGIKDEQLASFRNQVEKNASQTDLRLIELMLAQPNFTAEELARITSPVLVIAGSDDVIKEGHTKMIAKLIKGARLAFIPNSTHYVPFEQPTQLNQLVIDFLNGAN